MLYYEGIKVKFVRAPEFGDAYTHLARIECLVRHISQGSDGNELYRTTSEEKVAVVDGRIEEYDGLRWFFIRSQPGEIRVPAEWQAEEEPLLAWLREEFCRQH